MKLLLLCFLFPVICFGQTIYKGAVRDKKNNAAISFATVGLMKENIGTTTNETGIFEFTSIKTFLDDTLIITCLGYKVLMIKVSDLDTSKIEILLTEKSFNLKEIVVSNKKKTKTNILNDFDEPSRNYEFTFGGGQIAQHFIAHGRNCQLTKVKICDGSIIYRKPGRYRLRIYDMDSTTKAPLNDLCNQVIEVRTKLKRNGVYSINLEKYKIIIPDKDFFIAVEWLKIPFNKNNELCDDMNCYLPTIGIRKDMNLESWTLSYKNVWRSRQDTMLISATIKN